MVGFSTVKNGPEVSVLPRVGPEAQSAGPLIWWPAEEHPRGAEEPNQLRPRSKTSSRQRAPPPATAAVSTTFSARILIRRRRAAAHPRPPTRR